MTLEYNSEYSKLRQMKMPGKNASLNMGTITTYDGLSAFSGTTIAGSNAEDGPLLKNAYIKNEHC